MPMIPHGSHKNELSFYLTEGSLSEPQLKPKSPLISPILSPVPEPSIVLLLGVGLAGLTFTKRRR